MPKTQLQTAPLGATGLEITRVGFGAGAIGGGGSEAGRGPRDDEESVAAIGHALEQGVNWIDTAAAAGFGHSERIVGRALEGVTERPYVFTKGSLLDGPRRRIVRDLRRDSPGAVAVAWTLRNPAVDGAIVGFRRPDQVDPILTAAGLHLTAEDVEQIEGGAR